MLCLRKCTVKYYYWQYAAHPDSSFSFTYDDVVCAPDIRTAYIQSDIVLSGKSDYEYDVGVHVVLPIGELIREKYGEDTRPAGVDVLSNKKVREECRSALTADMLRVLGDKQETQTDVHPSRHQSILDWPYASQ